MTGVDTNYLKSIAGLNADELWRVCLDPETRLGESLDRDAAIVARKALGQW
jgi:hypothetical protein